jgi:signal transduction histidine kinase
MEEFGQLLRHELNNPLTGIPGNVERLLSEVRLRETVRRLSQEWEAVQTNSSKAKQS